MVNPNDPVQPLRYTYTFGFPDGTSRVFEVLLDARDLALIQAPRTTHPAWIKLTNHQCPDCPLAAREHENCPTAAGLVELIDFCQGLQSVQEVTVHVDVPQRTYSKTTSLQMGLSSLLGIYMAASGCPVLAQLRALLEGIPDRELLIMPVSIVGPVIGTYVGPGAVALGFIQE